MAERRHPRPGSRSRGLYQDWEVAQGVPEQDALDEARRREHARDDAQRIKIEGGFDAELFFGHPSSYAGERPAFDPADGWKPLPRHVGRSLAQQLSGAEFLRAGDGSLIAYRMPSDSVPDDEVESDD